MPESDIPRFRIGRGISEKQLERLRIRSEVLPEAGNGIETQTISNRHIISLARERIIPSGIERFKVVEVLTDHLRCNFHNATTEEEETSPEQNTTRILIAKPFQLRKTPFDGVTIDGYVNGQDITYTYESDAFGRKREADDGTDTEDQAMTPDYFIGEEILAVFIETGLKTNESEEDDPPEGEEFVPQRIFWEDLNTCGRFWARV